MTYQCQNCGVQSDNRSNLCNPAADYDSENLCAVSKESVCSGKREEMKFSCDSCGSVSATSDNLCLPVEIA